MANLVVSWGRQALMLRVNGEFDIARTESSAAGMVGNNPRESWKIPDTSDVSELDRSEKASTAIPISAGLAPAGSQLVSYNERIELSRSPLGLSRWKQRLVSYSVLSERPKIIADTVRRLQSRTSAGLLRSEWKLGSSRSVPVVEPSSRCFHPGKPDGELLSTGSPMSLAVVGPIGSSPMETKKRFDARHSFNYRRRL